MWPFKKKHFVPKRKISLVDALKTSINALEKDFIFYDWQRQSSCNCGIVVQSLLGCDSDVTDDLFTEARSNMLWVAVQDKDMTWREVCQKSCTVTGQPLNRVFKMLSDYGMRPEDIVHLEYLANPAIREVAGWGGFHPVDHCSRDNLIDYLKAWVRIIESDYKEDALTDAAVAEAKLLIQAAFVK